MITKTHAVTRKETSKYINMYKQNMKKAEIKNAMSR